MKMKLLIRAERYEAIRRELTERDIEVTDDADLLLSEANRFAEQLPVREPDSESRVMLPVQEVVFIDAWGHTVEVHTGERTYISKEPLYQLAARLDGELFLRVSKSVIVARRQIRKIDPTLSMKFILTMTDGTRVDVTRSYYYIFKEALHI